MNNRALLLTRPDSHPPSSHRFYFERRRNLSGQKLEAHDNLAQPYICWKVLCIADVSSNGKLDVHGHLISKRLVNGNSLRLIHGGNLPIEVEPEELDQIKKAVNQ